MIIFSTSLTLHEWIETVLMSSGRSTRKIIAEFNARLPQRADRASTTMFKVLKKFEKADFGGFNDQGEQQISTQQRQLRNRCEENHTEYSTFERATSCQSTIRITAVI